jgi:hypothetical protein
MKTTGSVIPIVTGKLLSRFEEINLAEMEQVKFLNRFDSKYCLHTNQLQTILKEICNDYFVLKIDGTRLQSYRSTYFDTPENLFYLSHHNGIAGRMKIRKREYVNSDICFTEIKIKSNKGKTNKIRISTHSIAPEITSAEIHFISCATKQIFENLEVKSMNSFNRITLVSKTFDERCTIDINIAFSDNDKSLLLENLVVIELKQGTRNMKSILAGVLKKNGIYKLGFSKYCMGRALTEKQLKKNKFKEKILKITKLYGPFVVEHALIPETSLAS